MSSVLDDARHITFNGYTDSYFDLVMSGNTPLLVPVPKQSSVTVPYANGTVDTSEMDGQIYWNDLTIKYTFACCISTLYSGVIRDSDKMNAICTLKTSAVENWLYSGPATLSDTGWSFSLEDAECTSINTTKVCANSHWIIKFEVTFIAPFNLTIRRPVSETHSRIGRFILYNGGASYEYGLIMSGNTPLTVEEPKITNMEWPHKNGTLNLSHCRKGETHGKSSLFFKDRTIKYNFFKSFSKYYENRTVKPTYAIHREMQDFIIEMCCWMYKHTNQSFVTIDGNVTYGGTSIMLADSALLLSDNIPVGDSVPCKFLPSARVTDLTFTKNIFNDIWALTMEVTFTAYPEFSYGEIYFPSTTEPSQTPSIIFEPWKHYADFNSFNDGETRIIWFEKDSSKQGQSMTLNIMDGIYMGCNGFNINYNGAGYMEDPETAGTYNPVGYVFQSSNLIFYNASIDSDNRYISLNVDEFKHESLESYDSEHYDIPTFMVTISPIKEIMINNTLYKFFGSLSPKSNDLAPNTGLYAIYEHRKLVDGEVVTSNAYMQIGAVGTELYSMEVQVMYFMFDENGLYQTIPETTDKFVGLDLDVPLRCQYLQRLSGNNVVDAYGLYAKNADNAPNNFRVLPYVIVLDYTSGNLEMYYRDAVSCPLVNTDSGHVVHGPDYYRETMIPQGEDTFSGMVALSIPMVNGEANEYVLCDGTEPPEGGDIQWLV